MSCGHSKWIPGILFFFATVAIGVGVGSYSWNGVIHLAESSLFDTGRGPAAIKKELDFSRLDGAELITATQKRLITAARVVLIEEGELGIELGHFVTRSEDGKKRLACDAAYNRVSLRFVADGIATSGNKPEMEVDAPCLTNLDNISSITPIVIPVGRLLQERPADMDLTYEDDVKFRFQYMATRWPLRWTLQSVRLYNNSDTSREVKISHREMRELRAKPFMVFWNESLREPSSSPEVGR